MEPDFSSLEEKQSEAQPFHASDAMSERVGRRKQRSRRTAQAVLAYFGAIVLIALVTGVTQAVVALYHGIPVLTCQGTIR